MRAKENPLTNQIDEHIKWKRQTACFSHLNHLVLKILSHLLLKLFKENLIEHVMKCLHKHTHVSSAYSQGIISSDK